MHCLFWVIRPLSFVETQNRSNPTFARVHEHVLSSLQPIHALSLTTCSLIVSVDTLEAKVVTCSSWMTRIMMIIRHTSHRRERNSKQWVGKEDTETFRRFSRKTRLEALKTLKGGTVRSYRGNTYQTLGLIWNIFKKKTAVPRMYLIYKELKHTVWMSRSQGWTWL